MLQCWYRNYEPIVSLSKQVGLTDPDLEAEMTEQSSKVAPYP